MSLLWISFRIILSINIGIGDARGGAGMIWCGPPWAFQKFYCAEFLNRNAAPVGRRTDGLQSTLALSAVLIAQNPQLSLPVPPQSVRAKQPMPILVHSGYRAPVFYCRPHQTIDVFLWLNCAKRYPHAFRIPGDQVQFNL
jgi:hypothetical protein